MDITHVTPEKMLNRLEALSLHLLANRDYTASKEIAKLKEELEFYFEWQRQRDI